MKTISFSLLFVKKTLNTYMFFIYFYFQEMKRYLINTSGYLKIVLKMLHLSDTHSVEQFQELATQVEEKISKCDDKIDFLSNLLPLWKEIGFVLQRENDFFLTFIQSIKIIENCLTVDKSLLPQLNVIHKDMKNLYIHKEKLDEIKTTIAQIETSFSIKLDQLSELLEKCVTMENILSEKIEQTFMKLDVKALEEYCLKKLMLKEITNKHSILVN